MRCDDCGTDISDRHRTAYLCRRCFRVRKNTRSLRDYHERGKKFPERRAAYFRDYYWRVARAKVLRKPKPCPTIGCKGTFRPWGNRSTCEECRRENKRYNQALWRMQKRKAA